LCCLVRGVENFICELVVNILFDCIFVKG